MVLNTVFTNIQHSLSGHIDWLVVNILMVVILLILSFALRSFQIFLRDVIRFLAEKFLFIVIMGGLAFIVISFVHGIRFKEYFLSQPVLFPGNLIMDTHWVRDDRTIYFIEDNKLESVSLRGENLQTVFGSPGPIAEYHFSVDGRFLLIVTDKDIFLKENESGRHELLDSYAGSGAEKNAKTVISDLQWAPDGQKFFYQISRWTAFSNINKFYLYDVSSKEKKEIFNPTFKINQYYWDKSSENLYGVRYETKEISLKGKELNAKIYAIPMKTLVVQFITEITTVEQSLPLNNLQARNIDLFLENDQYSFKKIGTIEDCVSEKGFKVGIDHQDILYYQENKYFRKKLFLVPRLENLSQRDCFPQCPKGELTIHEMRWIPGNRYVMIGHYFDGILVLEPASGRTGLLARSPGGVFGWMKNSRDQ